MADTGGGLGSADTSGGFDSGGGFGNLGGGVATQPAINTQNTVARLKILTGKLPYLINNPQAAIALASSPLSDEDMIDAAHTAFSVSDAQQIAHSWDQMTDAQKRQQWLALPENNQKLLREQGVHPPRLTEDTSLLHVWGHRAAGAVGRVAGDVFGLVPGSVKHVAGRGLHYLQVVGDTAPHIYRTEEALREGTSGRTGGEGLLSGITHPDRLARAWMTTGVGATVYTKDSRDKALEAVGGNQDLADLAHSLHIAGGEQLAEVLTSATDDPLKGQNRAVAITRLAKRVGAIGSPEFQQAYMAIDQALNDQSNGLAKAVSSLNDGHVSIGRGIARGLGLTEGDGEFSLISGSLDGTVGWLLDPTLLAGKALKAQRMLRWGIDFTKIADEARYGERVDQLLQAKTIVGGASPVKRAVDRLAEHFQNGTLGQVSRELPGYERQIAPIQAWAKAKDIPFNQITSSDIVQYLKDGEGMVSLAGGRANTFRHDILELPQLTAAAERRLAATGALRNVIDFTAAGRFEPVKILDKVDAADLVHPERLPGQRLGEFLGSTPGVRTVAVPAAGFLRAVSTQSTLGREVMVVGKDAAGHFAEKDIRLMGQQLATMTGISPTVRNFYINKILSAPDEATRLDGVRRFLEITAERAGYRSDTPETKELFGRMIGAVGKLYSAVPKNDIQNIDGLERHTGILIQAHRAESIAIPSFRDMARVTAEMNGFRTLWGPLNGPFVDSLIGKWWKVPVLMRVGYIPRTAGDEALTFLLRSPRAVARAHLAVLATRDEFGRFADEAGNITERGGYLPTNFIRHRIQRIEDPELAWKYDRVFYRMAHHLTGWSDNPEAGGLRPFVESLLNRTDTGIRTVAARPLSEETLRRASIVAKDERFRAAFAEGVSSSRHGLTAIPQGPESTLRVNTLGPGGELQVVQMSRVGNEFVEHDINDASDLAALSVHDWTRTNAVGDDHFRTGLEAGPANFMSPQTAKAIEDAVGDGRDATTILNDLNSNLKEQSFWSKQLARRTITPEEKTALEAAPDHMLVRALVDQDPKALEALPGAEHIREVAGDIQKLALSDDRRARKFVASLLERNAANEGELPILTNQVDMLDEAGKALRKNLDDSKYANDWYASGWSVHGDEKPVLRDSDFRKWMSDNDLHPGSPAARDDLLAQRLDQLGAISESEAKDQLVAHQLKEMSHLFSTADGSDVLHEILAPRLLDAPGREVSSIHDIVDATSFMNRTVQGPVYHVPKHSRLDDVINYGFGQVIGKAIDSVARTPLFMHNAMRAVEDAEQVTKIVRASKLTDAAANIGLKNGAEVERLFARAEQEFGHEVVDKWLNTPSRAPDMLAHFEQALGHTVTSDQLNAIRKAGLLRRNLDSLTRDVATERAVLDSVPFIHSHEIRSQFQEWGNNFVPFWFAEEQFLKRWARTARIAPEAFRRGQLMYMGLRHAGAIRKDEFGNDVFVYMGSGLAISALDHAASVVTGHGLGKAMPGDLTGQLKFSLPGVDEIGAVGFSPLVTMNVTAAANIFPELKPFEKAVLGERATGGNPLKEFMPTTIARLLEIAHPENYASATNSVMGYMEANGLGLRETASDDQRQQYLDRLTNHTRIMVGMRALFGFFGPSSPQFRVAQSTPKSRKLGDGLLRNVWFDMLSNYPSYQEAYAAFIKKYPDATPYTVFQSDTDSGAPIPATDAALKSMEDNKGFFNDYKYAGPWFLPERKTGDTFSRQAYYQQTAEAFRHKLQPKEYMRQLYFNAAADTYFATTRDARLYLANATGSDKQNVEAQMRIWKETYFKQHPVFAEELRGTDRQNKRDKVLDEMRQAIADPLAPPVAHAKSLATLVNTFDDYMRYQAELGPSRGRAVQDQKTATETAFAAWGENYIVQHPEVRNFWRSIIVPSAKLDLYDEVGA